MVICRIVFNLRGVEKDPLFFPWLGEWLFLGRLGIILASLSCRFVTATRSSGMFELERVSVPIDHGSKTMAKDRYHQETAGCATRWSGFPGTSCLHSGIRTYCRRMWFQRRKLAFQTSVPLNISLNEIRCNTIGSSLHSSTSEIDNSYTTCWHIPETWRWPSETLRALSVVNYQVSG